MKRTLSNIRMLAFLIAVVAAATMSQQAVGADPDPSGCTEGLCDAPACGASVTCGLCHVQIYTACPSGFTWCADTICGAYPYQYKAICKGPKCIDG